LVRALRPIPLAAVQNALDNDEIDELEVILTDVEKRYATAFQSGRIAESPAKLRRTLVGYFRAVAGQGDYAAPRCNAPHFSTVIDVDGTLRPCYFLPAYGKLKADLPLYEAINLPTAQALRQAYRTGQRAECARCVCPLYKDTRALLAM
jgi:Fe-coproporphyrin III synthase